MNFSKILISLLFLLCLATFCYSQNITDETNKKYKIGCTFGIPSYFNLLAGISSNKLPFGIQISGMYFKPDINGIQIKADYILNKNHRIGIAYGKSQDSGSEYFYIGPAYSLNYKKLFIETGVCKILQVNRGNFSNLPYWIIFQIGYVHQF